MLRPALVTAFLLALVPLAADAEEQRASFRIDKMTCRLCPITVSKAIERLDGVKDVTVDYAGKTATVVFDDARLSAAEIARATAEAGYPARRLP